MWVNDTRGYCIGEVCNYPYKQFFKFVKWLDDCPTKIEDLLEEANNEVEKS